jgi:hypothetical protein
MWVIAASSPTPTIIINNPASGDGIQTALFALVAVLLGALITGGFTYWVERYREHKAAEAEKVRHAIEVRRAARLIDDDLHTAVSLARWSIDHKEWWGSLERLTSTGWKEYRGVLAPNLLDNDWRSVSLAFRSIDLFQTIRDESAKSHRAMMATDPATAGQVATGNQYGLDLFAPIPLTDNMATRLQGSLMVTLELGRAALAPLMRDWQLG